MSAEAILNITRENITWLTSQRILMTEQARLGFKWEGGIKYWPIGLIIIPLSAFNNSNGKSTTNRRGAPAHVAKQPALRPDAAAVH
jgi:hypothetical protein